VFGKTRPHCEVGLRDVPETEESNPSKESAHKHAVVLQKDFVKLEQKWKKDVDQQLARGLESEHWDVLVVRVRRLEEVTQTVSPYDY